MMNVWKITILDTMGNVCAALVDDSWLSSYAYAFWDSGNVTLPTGRNGQVLKIERHIDVPADNPEVVENGS